MSVHARTCRCAKRLTQHPRRNFVTQDAEFVTCSGPYSAAGAVPIYAPYIHYSKGWLYAGVSLAVNQRTSRDHELRIRIFNVDEIHSDWPLMLRLTCHTRDCHASSSC